MNTPVGTGPKTKAKFGWVASTLPHFVRWLTSMDVTYPDGKCLKLTKDTLQACLDRYDTFLVDCDGVLWSNNMYDKFEGIGASVEKLRELGKHIYFVSNNTTHSKKSIVEKMQQFSGFDPRSEELLDVNEALVTYLRDIVHVSGKVYIVGSQPLADELEKGGFRTFGVGPDPDPIVGHLPAGIPDILQHKLEPDVGAVAFGMDGFFDFNKMIKATNFLLKPDCAFVATSLEPLIYMGRGELRRGVPIMGSLVASVEKSTGRQATVIGKPSPIYFSCVEVLHPEVDPKRTVMIGDYLDTDIAFAVQCGLDSILVCTGIHNEKTTMEAFKKNPSVALPNYIMDSFACIGKWAKSW